MLLGSEPFWFTFSLSKEAVSSMKELQVTQRRGLAGADRADCSLLTFSIMWSVMRKESCVLDNNTKFR